MTQGQARNEVSIGGGAAALIEQALTLIARQRGGDAATAREVGVQARAWRDADPQHEAAWHAADRLWRASDPEYWDMRMALPPSSERRRRQRIVAGLGIAAALASGALVLWLQWQQPLSESSLATTVEPSLDHALPDGTRLSLDARSRTQVAYYRDYRQVRLERGGAYLDVRPDPQRPFIVETPAGRVRVLGTAFDVRLDGDALHVAVAHGRVEVCPGAGLDLAADEPCPTDRAIAVLPGQKLAVGQGRAVRLGRLPADDVGAWRQGWLVFDDTPLPDVIARWNAYLPQPLELAPTPALQALRLTGSFPLDDPAAFVDALPQALPVQLVRDGNGSVRVEAVRR
ncbi:FecR family protein [Luteimonas sp. RIT-PG2_3]